MGMAVLYGPFNVVVRERNLEDEIDRTLERKEQEYEQVAG
jgi:hypothetical protein